MKHFKYTICEYINNFQFKQPGFLFQKYQLNDLNWPNNLPLSEILKYSLITQIRSIISKLLDIIDNIRVELLFIINKTVFFFRFEIYSYFATTSICGSK